MTFVSFSFLVLISIVLLFRFVLQAPRWRGWYFTVLLLASLVFYGWCRPSYIFIVLIPISLDYLAALMIQHYDSRQSVRRVLIIGSVVLNLSVLGFFKYFNFFTHLLSRMVHPWGLQIFDSIRIDAEIPLGISFFTFQSMSYTIDVYRRVIPPIGNPRDYLLFACFFPQMVSGPIVRAKEFLYQFRRSRRICWKVWSHGLFLIVQGLFLKVVLADHLGSIVDKYWATAYEPGKGMLLPISLALLFSGQIYCDFAGYSNMARGVAFLLGFRLPLNFNAPYIAAGFSEFWQRWHMSLSRWLRDYLYISLGGNKGSAIRTYVNLALVMILGGLWHGASLCFIVWGAIHGLALIIERRLGLRHPDRKSWFALIVRYPFVQVTVLCAWIFFRSDTLRHALGFFVNIGSLHRWPRPATEVYLGLVYLLPVVLIHARVWLQEKGVLPPVKALEMSFSVGIMLLLLVVGYADASATFIYFKF